MVRVRTGRDGEVPVPTLADMGARAAIAVLAVVSVVGWGVAAGLGMVLVVTRDEPQPSFGGVQRDLPAPGDLDLPAPVAADVQSYELSVHTDGCGVIRSEGPDGAALDDVTWSVTDADGFEVLGRNAQGETHYRYFGAGTYEVVLESWGGDLYVPVSNTVTITC